jgi:hypothetical protein
MHRICELELLARVATDMGAAQYIELGCGGGAGMKYVREAMPDACVAGYDWAPNAAGKALDVFSPGFVADVQRYVWTKPLFVYTDNGNKRAELALMAQYIAPGDMLGTHDWPNEVVTDAFLTERGFVVAEEYEAYIAEHKSLQRFWRLNLVPAGSTVRHA